MNKTAIPYLDRVWNPVTGCSYGCLECWARPMAKRFGWSFEPTFHSEKLGEPAKRKKPSTIGVCFTGDLFDPLAPANAAGLVLNHASWTPHHTYVFLTKRADQYPLALSPKLNWFPKDNWYLGVTVRNQAELDAAAPHIHAMESAGWKVWLSIEPMQGPVDISFFEIWEHSPGKRDTRFGSQLSGVILGGQSGPGAMPLHPDWVRAVRDQCAAANVPFMFKQWSSHKDDQFRPHSGDTATDYWPLLDSRTHTALAWPLYEKVLP